MTSTTDEGARAMAAKAVGRDAAPVRSGTKEGRQLVETRSKLEDEGGRGRGKDGLHGVTTPASETSNDLRVLSPYTTKQPIEGQRRK